MERIVDAKKSEEDIEQTLRPQNLDEYIGQEEMKENLRVFLKAAQMREEALDHVLLYGPPGLGKTTMAHIVANEMNSNIKVISGPAIEKIGDIATLLSSLEENDVLFIDEIHRVPKFIEEVLYSAMEDRVLDIMVGDVNSRNIKIELPPFTLVGATTRYGDLTGSLRDRFGIIARLNYYTIAELQKIIWRTSKVLDVEIEKPAVDNLAGRCRGTPRIANRLFKRVSDFALVLGDGFITDQICEDSLTKLQVDKYGLDSVDYSLLKAIVEKFNGGPVGVEALAASIGEEVITIEDVYEPFLLQNGFLQRTPRGRCVTEKTYQHLALENSDKLC